MRTISYAGDSTDGECYEEDSVESPPTGTKSRRKNLIEKLNKYKDFKYKYNSSKYQDFNYANSAILKEIGEQLLQSREVRSEYKKIKSKLTLQLSQNDKTNLERLDKLIGPSYSIIVSNYETSDGILSKRASDFFQINHKIIDGTYDQNQHYKNIKSVADKANFYITHTIKDEINNIYRLNKKIELYAQDQRQNIEPTFTKVQNTKEDASLFLAQIKAIKKLDKFLGINCIYDYKFGTQKHITGSSVSKKTTQKNETLEIHTLGAFSDYITDEGTYNAISTRLQRFIKDRYIDKSKLSEFFKSSLRGQEYSGIILNDELRDELTNQLQTLVKLMFGVEVKRNTATLLTNAMFFDLIDADIYKMEDIPDKIPMAMQGAVSASTTIDKEIKDTTEMKHTSEYDCRVKFEPSKARNLASKDEAILQDWLKYKLQETIDKKVTASDATVKALTKRLADLNITVEGLGRIKLNKDPMALNSGDNKFSGGKIQWSDDKSHIKSTIDKVNKVEAKVFFNLIKDWYGIELSYLNKDDFILLKAAAEPKDPTLDRDDYQGNVKLPTSDTASEGAASKMKLLDYKHKCVLNHSKLKASLDKMSSNKMITTKLHKVGEEINQALHKHLTAEELMSTLGTLFVPTNMDNTSEETMSSLKAIHLGLKFSEKAIRTNRLNLKDPNKHFMEGNILSIDDLFNGVLDRVNDKAIENERKDILATLQKYSDDHQEQIDIVGDIGI